MSYTFDVSSEHNDLWDVEAFLDDCVDGDYVGNTREDGGHRIHNIGFRDKRYALQFKLKFNATVVRWDESDDEEIVTIEDLLERGYEEMKIRILLSRTREFEAWCKAHDIVVVDEIKFTNTHEPYTIWLPPALKVLVKLTWHD